MKENDKNKQSNIISMFDDIAKQYDKINSYISLGLEKYWRNKSASITIDYFKSTKIDKIMDVACGTGKMMETWQHQFYKNGIAYKEMIGVDPSKEMLKIAEDKIDKATFLNDEAGNLSSENNSIDIISIAYGLRNIVDKESAFLEFNRVLKDDGIILVLEFVKDGSGSLLSKIKEGYIKNIIPVFARLFSNNKNAFIYLGTSIENLKEENIRDLFKKNGFDLVHIKSFNFEATHAFIAKKVKIIKQKKTISTKVKAKILDIPNKPFDIAKVTRNVGLSLFVEFFETFIDLDIEASEVIEQIMKKKKTSLVSTRTKVSNARRIIRANLESDALNIILEAKKVETKIKNKAKRLLKKIQTNDKGK